MQINRLFLTLFDKLTLSKHEVLGQEGKLIKRVLVVKKLGTPTGLEKSCPCTPPL